MLAYIYLIQFAYFVLLEPPSITVLRNFLSKRVFPLEYVSVMTLAVLIPPRIPIILFKGALLMRDS
jgi:hypothetical protein